MIPGLGALAGGGGLSVSEADNSVVAPTTNQSGGSQNVQLGAAKMLDGFNLSSQLGSSNTVLLIVLAVVAVAVILISRRR